MKCETDTTSTKSVEIVLDEHELALIYCFVDIVRAMAEDPNFLDVGIAELHDAIGLELFDAITPDTLFIAYEVMDKIEKLGQSNKIISDALRQLFLYEEEGS